MGKMIIMSGLPFAGKTCTAYMKYKAGDMIISRKGLLNSFTKDTIELMEGVNYARLIELETFEIKKAASMSCNNIFIDNNNLHPAQINYYKNLAAKCNYHTEVIELNVPLPELLRRHKLYTYNDPTAISRDMLINLAFKHKRTTQNSKFVLYELDDVLFKTDARFGSATLAAEYVGSNDYIKFFNDPDLVDLDECDESIKKMIEKDVANGNEIIFLTRRPEKLRNETIKMLVKNQIYYSRLIMMPDEKMNDSLWKVYAYQTYLDMSKCEMIYENDIKTIENIDKLNFPYVSFVHEAT